MAIKDRTTLKNETDSTITPGVPGGILANSDNPLRNDVLDSVITFRDNAPTQAFSTTIILNDQRTIFVTHQLIGNLSFTLGAGSVVGSEMVLTLLPDGVSTISFSNDFVDLNSNNFTDFDNDVINKIYMYFDVDGKVYVVIKPLLVNQLTTPTLAASPGDTLVDLTISNVDPNATGQTLEFYPDTDPDNWQLVPGYDGVSLTYQHTGLTNDTEYFYRVKSTAPGYVDSGFGTDSATPIATPISPEAQAVIDNFPEAPTGQQQIDIAAFVDGCVADGNWDLIANMAVYKGLSSLNKYRHWKTATDIIRGDGITASTFPNEVANGLESDSSRARYLNLNIIPSALGAPYTADNFGFGVRTESLENHDAVFTAIGILDPAGERTRTIYHFSAGDIITQIAGSSNTNWSGGFPLGLIMGQVDDSGGPLLCKGYVNGVEDVSNSVTVTTMATTPLYQFAANDGGSPSAFYEGVHSMFIIYNPTGFNHPAFNARLNTLLAAL